MHPADQHSGIEISARLDAMLERIRRPTVKQVVGGLMRRLGKAPKRWQRCPQQRCRRSRRCGSRNYECATIVLTREQQAATLAQLQQALGEGAK